MAAAESDKLSVEKLTKGLTECDIEKELAEGFNSAQLNYILSGSKLSDAQIFQNVKGDNVSVTPIIVDLRRILQSKCLTEIVPNIPNKELLHAVVALYNTSLSEMTPDVLYASVCDKQARTIILLRDAEDVVSELNQKRQEKCEQVDKPVLDDQPEDTSKQDEEDVYEAVDSGPSVFAGVFSDQDEQEESVSDEDEEEEEEEEEDYSHGINAFLRRVRTNKRKMLTSAEQVTVSDIGIEHRLAGAATFEKVYCNQGEKVIHLTLVSVRKSFQKFGMGKYLLSQVKDVSVVGQHDAVVVHADNGATDFFERYGFTDDVVLNSRWSELAEQYTNCTLMCYLPPFTNQGVTGVLMPKLDMIVMEKQISKWREKSLEAYRAEMTCMNRMRQEIIHLRALVSTQQELITSLTTDNEKIQQEKFIIERQYLDHRLSSAKAAFAVSMSDDDDEIQSDKLIQEMEQEIKSTFISKAENRAYQQFALNQLTENEPYDHGIDTEVFYDVTQQFQKTLKMDHSITTQYEVHTVTKAILPSSHEDIYKANLQTLNDSSLVTKMYFCGSSEKPHRLPEILRKGFSEQDFTFGEYGRGLYFSKYPSKAAHFSALGKMLVAEVALGCTQTVVKKEKTRKSPEEYFDSIITPGRLCAAGSDNQMLCQEYVIFDYHQVKPLHLISYSPKETAKEQNGTKPE